MSYTVKVNNGQITLEVSDATYPVAIVDLIRLHEIWRLQDVYSRIRSENDEYASGKRKGTIQYVMPIISVNVDNTPPKIKIPLLSSRPKIEIGFTNGMHRLDYFWRLGARILPVHTPTEASRHNVEQYIGASVELIAQNLIDGPRSAV